MFSSCGHQRKFFTEISQFKINNCYNIRIYNLKIQEFINFISIIKNNGIESDKTTKLVETLAQ